MEDNFVLLDCDMGADDAWALLTLIKAETVLNMFKILAITAIAGNTNVGNVTQNVYRMLDSVNRTDIPIYKGFGAGFNHIDDNDPWFGLDGFGDVLPNISPNIDYYKEEHAVKIMHELVNKYPKKISFVMTGPLTNLAAFILSHSDFLDKVKGIWILGGNLNGTEPEYNFRMDPIAAHIVLKYAAKVPVYLVPLEPTLEANKGIDLKFRFDYLGSVDSPTIEMLNKVEKSIFIPKNEWIANDAFLASAFVFPEKMIVASQKYHGTVKPYGKNAGLLSLDQSGKDNVHVIEKLNAENYKKIIEWAAGVPSAQPLKF